MKTNYYQNNKEYTKFLLKSDKSSFVKYSDTVKKYLASKEKFLDVGCGTGQALELIKDNKGEAFGLEISKPSVQVCRRKKLKCYEYTGGKFPFGSQSFTIVGSFNVLEHVQNPKYFLSECIRILKVGGYLILICPNFLSVSNNYHWHTKGFYRKLRNLLTMVRKLQNKFHNFDRVINVNTVNFSPDNDAINMTNPVDIFGWTQGQNLKLVNWSSQENYRNDNIKYIDIGIFRYFLGACFFVFKKL